MKRLIKILLISIFIALVSFFSFAAISDNVDSKLKPYLSDIVSEIEKYKRVNGFYPEHLADLKRLESIKSGYFYLCFIAPDIQYRRIDNEYLVGICGIHPSATCNYYHSFDESYETK